VLQVCLATMRVNQELASGEHAACGDRDPLDPDGPKLVVDRGLDVAPVGGHRWRDAAGSDCDPLDGGDQHRSVRRVADLDVVVEHDAAGVVEDLGRVGSARIRLTTILLDVPCPQVAGQIQTRPPPTRWCTPPSDPTAVQKVGALPGMGEKVRTLSSCW
jgi:hypothetical protein